MSNGSQWKLTRHRESPRYLNIVVYQVGCVEKVGILVILSSSSSASASYVGSIDQGTTSTRFILFDRFGIEVAKHQIPLVTINEDGKSG